MERNLAARARAPEPSVAAAGARYVRSVMEDAFPDAMVPREAYDHLILAMTNDPKDRHVLAAAVAARADVIVTFNVTDFPAAACRPYGIDVQHPDTFLVHQFGLMPERIAQALTELASERRPLMDTPQASSAPSNGWCHGSVRWRGDSWEVGSPEPEERGSRVVSSPSAGSAGHRLSSRYPDLYTAARACPQDVKWYRDVPGPFLTPSRPAGTGAGCGRPAGPARPARPGCWCQNRGSRRAPSGRPGSGRTRP